MKRLICLLVTIFSLCSNASAIELFGSSLWDDLEALVDTYPGPNQQAVEDLAAALQDFTLAETDDHTEILEAKGQLQKTQMCVLAVYGASQGQKIVTRMRQQIYGVPGRALRFSQNEQAIIGQSPPDSPNRTDWAANCNFKINRSGQQPTGGD